MPERPASSGLLLIQQRQENTIEKEGRRRWRLRQHGGESDDWDCAEEDENWSIFWTIKGAAACPECAKFATWEEAAILTLFCNASVTLRRCAELSSRTSGLSSWICKYHTSHAVLLLCRSFSALYTLDRHHTEWRLFVVRVTDKVIWAELMLDLETLVDAAVEICLIRQRLTEVFSDCELLVGAEKKATSQYEGGNEVTFW